MFVARVDQYQVPSLPGLSLQGVGSDSSLQLQELQLFVQDDIKVSRKLTLNLVFVTTSSKSRGHKAECIELSR